MKMLSMLTAVLLLTGCAVGNKYNYEVSEVIVPVRSESQKSVVLSVKDSRFYILNGDKEPNFVGLMRGGFGNPFDVTTASGKPMAVEMQSAIQRGLTDAGFQVIEGQDSQEIPALAEVGRSSGASRIVQLRVNEWKSDIYMSVTLHCNLTLNVHDVDGKLLADSTLQFMKPIGGVNISTQKNSKMVSDEFAKQVGYLFNAENIRAALK